MKKISLLSAIGVTLLLSSAPLAMAADPVEFDHETGFEELKERLLTRYTPLIQKFSGAEQATMLRRTLLTLGSQRQNL